MIMPLARGLSPLGGTATHAAVFSPTGIAGLQLWLKADSLALTDGDPVSTWADSSGNSNNATSSGASRPTYKAAILGGKPVVRFSSSASNYLVSSLARTQPYTVIIVSKQVAVATQAVIDGSVLNSGVLVYQFGALDQYAGSVLSTGSIATTSFLVISAIFCGVTSSMYVNGTLKISGTIGLANTTGTTIGCAGGFIEPLDGDIAELLVYNSVLGSTDRGNVETFLKTKYGL